MSLHEDLEEELEGIELTDLTGWENARARVAVAADAVAAGAGAADAGAGGGGAAAAAAAADVEGRGIHSFTFRLNGSAFWGIGGAFRGCLGSDENVSLGVTGCVWCQKRLKLS